MAKIFEDNSLSIGNTPLIRLNRITAGLPATVVVKIEGRNPAYSVKCRIGASMIWAAERDGILKRLARQNHRRGHQWQHGHCPGVRRSLAWLSARPDHARDDVARAETHAQGLRR